MKTMKRLLCLLLSAMVMFSLELPIQAHERSTHDEQMEEALLSKTFFWYMEYYSHYNKQESNDAIKALQCAAYLAIDQANGSGSNTLNELKERAYRIKNLPNSINEFNYTAFGENHRYISHRGWNANDSNELWIKRKNILLNTADAIFDFHGNDRKKDSFCAIIYYIHLLGDRESDSQYYDNNLIMELGGRIDKQDIISELIKHINILTSDSNNFAKGQRNHLELELVRLNEDVKKIKNANKTPSGGEQKLEGEAFMAYKDIATDIVQSLLPHNLPEILKGERWFSDVFYSK